MAAKFVIVAGQSNALEVGDAQSWEELHPYVALRRPANTDEQTRQFTGGAYSDTYRLPITFFGGPQRDRLGDNSFGNWQSVNVMSRAVQAVRFLTPYDPAGHYTNLGTSSATNYPGTCEILAVPTPTGTTFATNVRWQQDPVGLTLTRRRTGIVHTIAAGWASAGSTITVSPPLVPAPEIGEQFTYEFAAGANSASTDELVLCNQFGGLQDVGSILDSPALSGAITTGAHPVTASRIRNFNPTADVATRITLRSRPVSIGATVSFGESAAASAYTSLGGASMSGTTITSITALGDVPWVVGYPIKFASGDGALPANIVAGDRYWVITVSGRDIEISTTEGGSALSVGAGFAAGGATTGPSASGAAIPDAITAGSTYYITRPAIENGVLESLTLSASTFSTSVGSIHYEGHGLGVGEEVLFGGVVADELSADARYYVSPGVKPIQFQVSTDPEDLAGTIVTTSATGGVGTLTRQDGYFAFYIAAARGGTEIIAATDTGRWPSTLTPTVTAQESYRGSLTGLQATCTSGTAANVGVSRGLGDVRTDGTNAILKCATAWPSAPQTGDKFTIEVPPLGQESIPFRKFALWLPWCQFEGRAPYRGPGLATVGSAAGSEAFVTLTGIATPEVGSVVKLYTSGNLPSPFKPGRDYYVHTAAGTALFLKETFAATEAIQGDDIGGGSGTHSITVHDQDGKINPFPPGFNYPNHHGVPRSYQPFEGPSLIGRNPRIGIAPGLGLKLHEYYGETMNVAVCAVGGTSIGHKEVYANPSGAPSYGWLDVNQHKSWSPGEENNCFGRYEDVLDSANFAFGMEDNTAECIGIVFPQGEEDASHLELANNYLRSGRRLRTAMRQSVKDKGMFSGPAETIPFVWPKIKSTPWPYAATVNAAIQLLVDEDAYSRTYEVEDLTLMSDGVHYDGAGQSIASERAYAALIDMNRDGYTKVQVCNMALANLGDTGTITSLDPPDASLQASLCSQYYALALNKALERHNWDFSKRRVSPVAVTTDRTEWLYSYTLPGDYAGVIAVLPKGTTDDLSIGGTDIRLLYSVENDANLVRRIYCNEPEVVLRYNAKVKDPTQWSDSFVLFLSWMLSSMIGPPLLKGSAGIDAARKAVQMLELYGQQATAFDSVKTRKKGAQDADAIWDTGSR